MTAFLCFDYCAIAILIVILLTLIVRNLLSGMSNALYLCFVTVVLVCTVFEILAYVPFDVLRQSYQAKYIWAFLFYVFKNGSFVCYLLYIVAITDMWYKTQNIFAKIALCIPFIATVVIAVVSYFTELAFYIDKSGYIVPLKAHWYFSFCNAFYAVYAIFVIFYFRKINGRKKSLALACYGFASIIAYYIDKLFVIPKIHMFMLSLGILSIMIFVNNTEWRIEINSGFDRISAYMHDLKKSYVSKKHFYIIQINVLGFTDLKKSFNYNSIAAIITLLSNKVREINNHFRLHANLYYLKNGKFRIVVSEKNDEVIRDIADYAVKLFNCTENINGTEYNFSTAVCISKCPEDFKRYADISNFDASDIFNSKVGEVCYASEFISNLNYEITRNIDAIIERGFKNNSYKVYYQPIYSIKEGRYTSAEALARLEDEEFGYISPSIFITSAEKNGAINRIGMFVLEEVCKFVSSNEFKKLNIEYIEVNLSVVQCLRKNIADEIIEMVKKYGVKPSQINFEITESVAANNQKVFFDNIKKIKSYGFNFSLDDFGTGYSSIQMVLAMPLSIIKIDKSFVDYIDNEKTKVIIENTIKMVKRLGLKIVVEGIETESTLKEFVKLECDYIQGFYYSRPVSCIEFLEKVGLEHA